MAGVLMGKSIQLSAVIITYNEEKKIGRCLDSLRPVADQLLVVDREHPASRLPVAQVALRGLHRGILGHRRGLYELREAQCEGGITRAARDAD